MCFIGDLLSSKGLQVTLPLYYVIIVTDINIDIERTVHGLIFLQIGLECQLSLEELVLEVQQSFGPNVIHTTEAWSTKSTDILFARSSCSALCESQITLVGTSRCTMLLCYVW